MVAWISPDPDTLLTSRAGELPAVTGPADESISTDGRYSATVRRSGRRRPPSHRQSPRTKRSDSERRVRGRLPVETGRNPFPAASDPRRDGPKMPPAPADISAASAPFVPAARRRALLVASFIGQLRWRPDYADTEVRVGKALRLALTPSARKGAIFQQPASLPRVQAATRS